MELITSANPKSGSHTKLFQLLLDVSFSDVCRPAIEYVLGTTLVCFNGDDAKRVTFHKDVKTRTVTTEGDLFDPAGTLTGGSKPTGTFPQNPFHGIRWL